MSTAVNSSEHKLGIRENWGQFSLLVLVNAFVGAMVGLERSILPTIAEESFEVGAKTAILSFIVVFGLSKAMTNYVAGRLSEAYGRKAVLVGGWLVALPVPLLLMWAPSWNWIVAINALLGISQGLTWSTTVIMKIDLAGPKERGMAMGLNEFAGYLAVAGSALATGYVASIYGARTEPFYLGVGFAVIGTLLSIVLVRDTREHAELEAKLHHDNDQPTQSAKEVFMKVSFTDPTLSAVSQAGLVNNLNDGMAWGLFPILFASAGLSIAQIGALAAIYPAVWGLGQLVTGSLSDRWGRKGFITFGMWLQAIGIAIVAVGTGFTTFALALALIGAGTAMVYPTLLAAIGDVAHPSWRSSAVGIYRLWRDSGYAAGAVCAGVIADLVSVEAAIWSVAALTVFSGIVVQFRMRETNPQ
jgi:MFS family permease